MRQNTIWIRHEQDEEIHTLVIGDDGGEIARTSSTNLTRCWDSAKPYIESITWGTPAMRRALEATGQS
jgi:hypothetical protein